MYNTDYHAFAVNNDMNSNEGESLKAFIKDKGTIAMVIDRANITRSKLNWLMSKDTLSDRDKREVMGWIIKIWPESKNEDVFDFWGKSSIIKSDGNVTRSSIIGDGNTQATEGSSIVGNSETYIETIKMLKKKIEILENTIRDKEVIIGLLQRGNQSQ